MLAVSILTLLGHALATPIIRHHPNEETEVILTASGETQVQHRILDPGVSTCNHHFVKGTENTNDCPAGTKKINEPDQCAHGASYFAADGYVAMGGGAANHPFITNNDLVPDAILPYPQNCFAMANGSVYYNPSQTLPATFTGTPICWQDKFQPGGTDDGTDGGGCPDIAGGGYEKVLDYHACMSSFNCTDGEAGCLTEAMEDAADFSTATAPKGCYRLANGCVNFNRYTGATSTVTGTPICRAIGAHDGGV